MVTLFAISTGPSGDPVLIYGLALAGALSVVGFIGYKLKHTIGESAPAIGEAIEDFIDFWYDRRTQIVTRRAEFRAALMRLQAESQRAPRLDERRVVVDIPVRE